MRINSAALALYAERAERGRVVAFDTETTGTGDSDEIVEIAAVEYVDGERTRDFSLYVNPTCPIHPAAEAVHRLSREFLAEHGVEPRAALERFFGFLGSDVLAVAHNAAFDVRMVRNACRKFGFVPESERVEFCDTLALSKRLVAGVPNHRLGTLVSALGLEGENTHDALDDTIACGSLFFRLVSLIPREGECVFAPDGFA